MRNPNSKASYLLPDFHLPLLGCKFGAWFYLYHRVAKSLLVVLALPTFIPNFCSYDDGTPVNIAAAQPKAIGISGTSKNNYTQSNVVSPFFKIGSAQSSSKPSSIQGWHATMKDAVSKELNLLCPQRA
ncbi:hypothetical protein SLEP1_g55805 [Rubroshorea leprosula]|uniref:Uncharacterized protein n=1 Tax=Rubroshorea leprosula TaxID=152421 RepID=A0AAV5MHP3_9ROSI|nr:hypothetical protein SLEP1_g55805 [Rubroshorea leprosula]